MVRRIGALAVLIFASCHAMRGDERPLSPVESCRYCCQQAFDACKLDSDAFPMARCPPRQRECNNACDQGDQNEMCVVETNRQLAATAPKQLPAPVATARTEPSERGACDNEGTWKLTVEAAHGESRGCVGVESIPKQVSFRIERKHKEYALRDLSPEPGWTDAFSIQNEPDRCLVTLRRDNHRDKERLRVIEVKLAGQGGAVSGTFHYEEATIPRVCALESKVVGSVVVAAPPRPAPVPATPPTRTAPTPRPGGEKAPTERAP
jgi:hypothetical protein